MSEADPGGPGGDEPQAGIATFVGRVRGRLDAEEEAWVADTSARVEALRASLAEGHLRLVELETAAGSADEWTGPAGLDSPLARRLGTAVVAMRREQLVDELLSVGVLPAPPGATGEVAVGPAGAWHLELTRAGGGTVARADVLLGASADDVLAHLAEHPTTDVVYATSDTVEVVAATDTGPVVVRPGDPWPARRSPVVVDIGVAARELDDEASEVRALLEADGRAGALSVEPLLDAVPLLALAVIAGRAAVGAATTDETGGDIGDRAWRDARDVVAGASLSRLVTTVSGMALLRLPLNVTIGLSRSAARGARSDIELSLRRVQRIRRLLAEVHG